ncbi:efflux transporter outer membrane subunit [Rouxiella badensis]|uniref:TolC family protein n=1 Tax=Rahnella perminowiae TaxID=2816244 RepID=A0ABS6KW16_9GAMM|nr:TolC family protein [Rahnella perminowiae]MBU9848785.1 TolC family protein [Rahnella aceris]MCC3705242.1 efflux transporter outer membrane subunit [Rouxiella badensis]MBU9833518.1 TolC family protein [Rahnella perminowiae]MBU9860196.1 TolC family protein [Rahnella aceris]
MNYLILLSLPFLLAGCISLDPKYQRPIMPVPNRMPHGGAYSTQAGGTLDMANSSWRDYIIDDRLRKVVAMSLDSSRDLRETVADVKSAQAQYEEERSSLLPTVDAEVSNTRSRSLTGVGNQTAISNSASANASTSSFELDLFGKNQSLTREEYEAYLGTQEGARSTELTVIYNVVNYWIILAADKSNLETAKQTMASAADSLQVTQNNYNHGISSMVDVASADSTYQSARADVANYTTSVAQDKNALDLAVGKSVPADLLPSGIEQLKGIMRDMPPAVSSAVLLNRPDVLEAEHNLKATNASIGAARANFFPSISLTASGGVSSSQLSSLFKNGASTWSFSPSISLPIFAGGYNVAALKYSKAQKELYVATYEKSIQSAFQEVADALARRGTIQEQLNAHTAYVNASLTYYQLADLRYRRGVDTYINALDAQRTLYSARQNLISTQETYYQNLITLYKVMGGGTSLRQ